MFIVHSNKARLCVFFPSLELVRWVGSLTAADSHQNLSCSWWGNHFTLTTCSENNRIGSIVHALRTFGCISVDFFHLIDNWSFFAGFSSALPCLASFSDAIWSSGSSIVHACLYQEKSQCNLSQLFLPIFTLGTQSELSPRHRLPLLSRFVRCLFWEINPIVWADCRQILCISGYVPIPELAKTRLNETLPFQPFPFLYCSRSSWRCSSFMEARQKNRQERCLYFTFMLHSSCWHNGSLTHWADQKAFSTWLFCFVFIKLYYSLHGHMNDHNTWQLRFQQSINNSGRDKMHL